MKHHCCIVIILRWVLCRASWIGSRIVLDSDSAGGNTQLIFPNAVPHTVGSVNFGLPHYWYPVAVRHPGVRSGREVEPRRSRCRGVERKGEIKGGSVASLVGRDHGDRGAIRRDLQ